jgi:hypothetical protein
LARSGFLGTLRENFDHHLDAKPATIRRRLRYRV